MSAAAAGFVWDPRLASHVYRPDHPLKPWRLQGVHDTLERLGAFALPNARLLQPRLATRAELERIHDPAYVDAVARYREIVARAKRGEAPGPLLDGFAKLENYQYHPPIKAKMAV